MFGILRPFLPPQAASSDMPLTPPAQAVLRTRPALLLGRLSFPIYLLHWPVLMTLGAGVFVAALLALAVGGAATLALAEAFERWVDAPAVALSRRLRSAARPVARSA